MKSFLREVGATFGHPAVEVHEKHRWKRGHWERSRTGHHYVESRWIERNNSWALERGHWNPDDRDGDGVPNRRDRQLGNPNRR